MLHSKSPFFQIKASNIVPHLFTSKRPYKIRFSKELTRNKSFATPHFLLNGFIYMVLAPCKKNIKKEKYQFVALHHSNQQIRIFQLSIKNIFSVKFQILFITFSQFYILSTIDVKKFPIIFC